jgi:hypothetical protein
MRLLPSLLLVTSALSLAACGGGGGGESLFTGGISNNAIPCPITEVDTTPDKNCLTPPDAPPATPAGPDADGDGVTDKDDKDGTVGSGAGGNNAAMSSGNKAIVLQNFLYDKPNSETALVELGAPGNAASQAAADTLFLSANKPKTVLHTVDTKSANNSKFSVPVAQSEYKAGTQDLDWIGLGHHNINLGTLSVTQSGQIIGVTGGNPVSYSGYPILLSRNGARNVVYDPGDKKYKVATRNTNPDPDNDLGIDG